MDAGPLPRTDHEEAAPAAPVPFRELASWFLPWIIGAALCVIILLGLWTASAAPDSGTYALGFAASGVALLALAVEIKAALDGTRLEFFVATETGLVLLLVLLTALAVAGLILAARSDSVAVEATGYALFVASLVLGFWNLKRYYDRRDLEGLG